MTAGRAPRRPPRRSPSPASGAGVATQDRELGLRGALPDSVAAKKPVLGRAARAGRRARRRRHRRALLDGGPAAQAQSSSARAASSASRRIEHHEHDRRHDRHRVDPGRRHETAAATAPTPAQGGVLDKPGEATQPLTSGGSSTARAARRAGTNSPTPLPCPTPSTVVPTDVTSTRARCRTPARRRRTWRRRRRRTGAVTGALGGGSSSAATPARFLESLTDTSLYSIGAYFSDRHPDLVDDVIAQSVEIEQDGLERWPRRRHAARAAFQTLVTGLAVRYFKAIAGAS